MEMLVLRFIFVHKQILLNLPVLFIVLQFKL